MALPKPRDVDLGVFVLDVDVLLVVDAREIRPTVPQILERPALEEVHREHVMLVVCLLRPAARGKEQRGDGARPEEHRKRAERHDLHRRPDWEPPVLIHVMDHAGHALAVGPFPLSLEVRDSLLEPGGAPIVLRIEIRTGITLMGEVVGELRSQLDLDGCYRTPESRAKPTIKLVDLPNVIETRALDEGAIPLEREPVAAEPIVVQVAQPGDGKLLVGNSEASPLHFGELLLIGCGIG